MGDWVYSVIRGWRKPDETGTMNIAGKDFSTSIRRFVKVRSRPCSVHTLERGRRRPREYGSGVAAAPWKALCDLYVFKMLWQLGPISAAPRGFRAAHIYRAPMGAASLSLAVVSLRSFAAKHDFRTLDALAEARAHIRRGLSFRWWAIRRRRSRARLPVASFVFPPAGLFRNIPRLRRSVAGG